jgi:hypothetical protein
MVFYIIELDAMCLMDITNFTWFKQNGVAYKKTEFSFEIPGQGEQIKTQDDFENYTLICLGVL